MSIGSARTVAGAAAAAAATAALVGILRRTQLNWGAHPAEVARPLPGDDVVPNPQYVATNAVTIDRPPSAVWPWLVQMGAYTRAGWYSFDRLDNGGVASSWEIVPELQHLSVGDVMPTDADGGGFVVSSIDPERSLVLVIDDADALTSSAFVLEPQGASQTRLLVRLRLRARSTPRGLAYRTLMEVGHVIMTVKTLHGIKARAHAR